MTTEEPIGHITLRVPVFLVTESESWEMPKEYTYLAAGEAELVSHDIPFGWHESLREELIESGGIEMDNWTPEQLADTCTRSGDEPARERPELILNFTKEMHP